ncbi:MAG: Inner membrane protein YccS [Candidatus Celerinatantimonas neptuna]|nr:MAG: Inner membrane protein YccS [Candidatus Celerinatantimonas neptuna]
MHALWNYIKPPSLKTLQFSIASKFLLLTVINFSGYYLHIPLPYIVTTALGIVAAALADHPALYVNRFKSLCVMLLCFGLASFSVTALFPYPWLFALGVFSSTFLFVMLAGIDLRFGPVTLSALILAIYTMLGYGQYSDKWHQPLLFLLGGLGYFLLSFLIHWITPNQSIAQQSEQLFTLLAKYQATKSQYFGHSSHSEKLRLKLASLASDASLSLAQMRRLLVIRQAQNPLSNRHSGYLDVFFKAQLLIERMISSHIDYQGINRKLADTGIPSQLHFIMLGLAKRIAKQTKLQDINDTIQQSISHVAQIVHSDQQVRKVLGHIGQNQLSFMLNNLSEMERLTRQKVPFPSHDFQFEGLTTLSWKEIKQKFLNPSHLLFRHALRQAICMLTGYAIILLIPGPPHGQDYWLLLTTLLVTKPNYSATRQRLLERIVGTLIGIAIATALVILKLPIHAELFVIVITGFLFFWYFSHRYAIAVVMITLFVALALQILGIDSSLTISIRIIATLLGALLVYIASRFIWPDWLENHNPEIIHQLIEKIHLYQQVIFEQYQQHVNIEDERYRLARFHAHTSEAELGRHWQSLLAEPVSKRNDLTILYQLTGHFHSYLSHLSALALYRGRSLSPQALQIMDEISLQFRTALDEMSQKLSREKTNSPQNVDLLTQSINQQLRVLMPNLHGEDLLITFQLQKMTENLEQIQSLISERQL